MKMTIRLTALVKSLSPNGFTVTVVLFPCNFEVRGNVAGCPLDEPGICKEYTMATLNATVTFTFQTESYGRKANLRAVKFSSTGGSQDAKKLFLNGLYNGSLVAIVKLYHRNLAELHIHDSCHYMEEVYETHREITS